jgi:hypothetical protein
MICLDGNVKAYAHGPRTPRGAASFAILASTPASRREAKRGPGVSTKEPKLPVRATPETRTVKPSPT